MTVDAPANGIIPLPNSVGALYAIPSDQWRVIGKRVSDMIQVQQIAAALGSIPSYPPLLAACTEWKAKTFPSIVTQSTQVVTFAADMSSVLQKIQGETAGLKAGEPLPEALQFLFSVEFEADAKHAGLIQAAMAAIAPDVATFVAANQAFDAAVRAEMQSLPAGCRALEAEQLNALGAALPAVQDGWTALSAQLQGLAAGTVTVTTAALLRADLASVIAAWTALGQSASAFVGQASALT